jgi:hypothetical protein
MYMTTNSTQVWKRMADESQHSAKMMARLSVALAVLLVVIATYAISASAQYSKLCTTIETLSGNAETAPTRAFGQSLSSTYCG